jgi:hypothetical protein
VSTRRLLALLCVAVVGVVLAIGLVVTSLLGAVGGVVYAVAAVALLLAGAARGRRLLATPARGDGRTCTCCTATQFDPVQVVE